MSANQGQGQISRVIQGFLLEDGQTIEQGEFVCKHKTTGLCRPGASGLKDYYCVGRAVQSASAVGRPSGTITIDVEQGDICVRWADGQGPSGVNLTSMMYVTGPLDIATSGAGVHAEAGKLVRVERLNPNVQSWQRPSPMISIVTL